MSVGEQRQPIGTRSLVLLNIISNPAKLKGSLFFWKAPFTKPGERSSGPFVMSVLDQPAWPKRLIHPGRTCNVGGLGTHDSGRKGRPAPKIKHGMRMTAKETRHEM